ncbi:MAG: sigma-54-dependent Fis family transcriptional regulator [Deltaproteobacteria bacterium]|nr:sigma-54-dependent Fis family transcriptional regulator [Deltaproteobacteria bacterium]
MKKRRVEDLADPREGLMVLSPTSNLYIDHPKDRARTDDLWERFHCALDSASPDAADAYAAMLLSEWRRCQSMGVDPALQHAPVVSGGDFERLLQARKVLLDSAAPILDKVETLFAGVPGILILGDEEGTILRVAGDPRVRLRAANKANLVEGGRWNEAVVGTNGIGTPLTKKYPVHVYSSEHFCEHLHIWTCAGAPILDPLTKEPLGVIDFTTYERDFRENAVALAYSLAVNVASELRLKRELERVQLIHQYALSASRFPSDEVVVLDRNGRVVRGNAEEPQGDPRGAPRPAPSADGAKEVREICLPGTDAPIGTLIVRPRERPASHFVQSQPDDRRVLAFGGFLTRDPHTKQLMERIGKISRSDLGVLLVGETGTGKEVIANYIHGESKRRAGPYIAVNCGAINKELFESTFFGYDRGAFTGADSRGRKGLFDSANGGTLFLDEIGEMPLDIQAGLLRVLETRTFRRVGSDRELSTDCRIIAATNRPLGDLVAQGTFRSDLYYRLSVVKLDVPPLRERADDIPVLVEHLLEAACAKYAFAPKSVSEEAMTALLAYRWPGNVRELRNVVESACVSSEDLIELEDLPPEIATGRAGQPGAHEAVGQQADETDYSLRSHEAKLILEALKKYKKVSLVAEALGLSRATLYRRFEALGIDHHHEASSVRTRDH